MNYALLNRLVIIRDSGAVVAAYAYDGFNRRVKKVVDSTARHYFYSSNWQVLEERVVSSSDAARHFVWGPRYVDDLICCERDTSDPANGILDERIYCASDMSRSVTSSFGTNGLIVERYVYAPYGNITIYSPDWSTMRSVSLYDIPYAFTGRELDGETGLHAFRARYYDANLGRFISSDPTGYRDGMNRYAAYFVPNLVDPSGMGVKEDLEEIKEKIEEAAEEEEWKDLMEQLPGIIDAIRDHKPAGAMDAAGAALAAVTDAFVAALQQFTSKSRCGDWYKNTINAIVKASKGDDSGCASIHANFAADNTTADKCCFDIASASGLGRVPGEKFARFSQRLAGDCSDLAKKRKPAGVGCVITPEGSVCC